MSKTRDPRHATILAGIPSANRSLFHRIRFAAGDPAAIIELADSGGKQTSTLIIRDIEMGRAARHARADRIACPADFAPEGGLSGDRETAMARAAAEMLRRAKVDRVVSDRTLPLIYVDHLKQVGIQVCYDPEMGVAERRTKNRQEIESLRRAQQVTEEVMRRACELIAKAAVRDDRTLTSGGKPLTSERVKAAIDVWLLNEGFETCGSIVAGGTTGAECHDSGSGALRTEETILLDIFPRSRETGYHGDCSRTVVHGSIPEEIKKMHAAVLEAKSAAIAAVRSGVSGETVHLAAVSCIERHGYSLGLPTSDSPESYCAMVHGTGHGIGLDVHEPPLLDHGGAELVVGDAITIEPGLYRRDLGGVRVEDMLIVTADGCENLNRLPEGLDWT